MASNKKTCPQSSTSGRTAADCDDVPGIPLRQLSGQKRTRTASLSETNPVSASPQQLPPRPRRSWTRRSASWTNEEDEMLIQLVKKETAVPPSITASKTWSRVAAQLKNRTGKQCRERYLNQLRPGICRDPWSPEEERILHEVHARIGNKWVAIAEQLPGRTDNCVKNHWNSMLRKRQRREAALRAAQKNLPTATSKSEEVAQPQTPTTPSVASLSPTSPGAPSSLSSPLFGVEMDRSSDADFSSRTGCATPSGLSSILDVGSSSCVPSPFTASSPITPKRDVKLQISSLVAASNSEPCGHGEGYFTKDELACTQGISSRTDDVRVDRHLDNTLTTIPENTRTGESVPSVTEHQSTIAKDVHHVQQTAIPCATSMSVHKPGPRPLRRSSRLTGGAEKGDAAEALSPVSEIMKQRKSGAQKMRKLNESDGNPLAALAIAASSVPPSPLTPEPRMGTTNRNRPSSPYSRGKNSPGKKTKRPGSVSDVPATSNRSLQICTSDVNTVSGSDGGPIRKSRRLDKSASLVSPASIAGLEQQTSDTV